MFAWTFHVSTVTNFLQMYPHLPLTKRIASSRTYKPAAILGLVPQQMRGPRGSYRIWDDTALQSAVAAVDKGVPYRQAAEMYGVPKSTVYDHVSGRVAFGARPGPDPYLSVEEEEELASFLIQTAKIGYPHTKRQVLVLVQQMVDAKGIDTTISNGWWERFCKRHPKITLRAAVPLSLARAMASDGEVLNKYFEMLEEEAQQKKERKLERERKAKLKKELQGQRPTKQRGKKETQPSTLGG